MLTHYLLFEPPQRDEELRRYVARVTAGGDPVRAFEEAFGLDLPSAATALRAWMETGGITPLRRRIERTQEAAPRAVKRAEVLVQIGNLVMHGGDRAAAIEIYRQAVAEDPENGAARAMLGVALKQSGAIDEAIAQLETAARAGVSDPAPYLVYAHLLLERAGGGVKFGDAAPPPAGVLRARALLQAAIALDDANSDAWAALGKTWIHDRSNFDDGIKASERSLAIDARNEDAALSLVILHLKKNDLDRAEEALDKRLRPIAKPASLQAAQRAVVAWKLHRADALSRAGELAEAKRLIADVLASTTDDDLRRRLEADLQQIELTEETVRLTEVYNRAVRAFNEGRAKAALPLVEQVLREARDPALRRDAEKLKKMLQ